MASYPPVCEFGLNAPDFALPDTKGVIQTRDNLSGPNGLLVMFICNHCPYVISIAAKLARDGALLQEMGVGVVAVNANDAAAYPEDSFENMGVFAAEHGFSFPYLYDQSQAVARAFGAVCTPDFFGYNAALTLQYRGRLDGSGRNPSPMDKISDLVEGMKIVVDTGVGPAAQIPSMGCSIKWIDD